MKRAFLVAAAASSLSCVDAFNVAAPTGPAGRVCRATTAGLPALTPMGPTAALPARLPRANLVMQEQDFYDVRAPPPELPPLNIPSHLLSHTLCSRSQGYVETDPVTGEKKVLELGEKEKLYLECLDAYYNEGGKQLLSNEEYEQLKLDLDFEGSKVAVYSKDEIKFVLANKRYAMGKPIMSDSEYNSLRTKLKDLGSLVVLHDGASCSLETGQCKTDMRVDNAKLRLLYLPGTVGGLLVVMEALYWATGLDPFISVVLGAVPAYFFGVWFTENVFAQKPLVAQAVCPECQFQFNLFFGDLFGVQTDGIVPPKGPPGNKILCKCPSPSCKIDLEADRDTMIIITAKSKVPA